MLNRGNRYHFKIVTNHANKIVVIGYCISFYLVVTNFDIATKSMWQKNISQYLTLLQQIIIFLKEKT